MSLHQLENQSRLDFNASLQVYAILDEVFLAGEIEETSKQVVLTRLEHLDKLE
jgi:Clathrin adaptor complex small chain